MATGTYSMSVMAVQKTVEMTVSGSFTPEKAQEFIADYQSQIGKIKADEFVLKFDCRDLAVVTQDMIPDLESCFALYKSSGFKMVEVGIKKSAVLKMQLSRLARKQGLTNFEVQEIY